MEDEQDTAYLRKQRRKKPSMSLSCCFHSPGSRPFDYESGAFSPGKSSPLLSPSSWFKSKGHHEFPEIKGGKSRRNLMSRMGGRPARRHSADFSYDPLSYALNFDEGASENTSSEDFFTKLPGSPPRRRMKDLELPSPSRPAAHPPIESFEMPPPASAAGRTGVESPAAASGGKNRVERPRRTARGIPVE